MFIAVSFSHLALRRSAMCSASHGYCDSHVKFGILTFLFTALHMALLRSACGLHSLL